MLSPIVGWPGTNPKFATGGAAAATRAPAQTKAATAIRALIARRDRQRVPMRDPFRWGRILAPVGLDRGARLPISFTPLDRLPLVVELLAGDERDLGLHAGTLEVERQGDARRAGPLDLPREALDLPLVQEELPLPLRVGVVPATGRIRRDVDVPEPGFAALHGHIAVLQVRLSVTQRFHLGAGQREPRIELLLDE